MDGSSDDTKAAFEEKTNEAFDLHEIKRDLPSEVIVEPTTSKEEDEFCDAKDTFDNDVKELDLDVEELKEMHKNLSDDELQKLREDAIELKNVGNELYQKSQYEEAIEAYTKGLNTCPLKFDNDRSVLFANRGAAEIGLGKSSDALIDCTKAIELNPKYLKALLRRAQLYRKTEHLDRCLEDYKAVMELDKNNAEARCACATLPAEINEKNEKMKQEMFGKLKELGNMVLNPFGISTDNFKVVQDPSSGSYSINFQKDPS